mgnify:CR=1 FL=1
MLSTIIVLRYVADQVYEKLIAVVNYNSSSDEGLIQLMDALSQGNINNLGPIRIMRKYVQDLYAYFWYVVVGRILYNFRAEFLSQSGPVQRLSFLIAQMNAAAHRKYLYLI